MYENRNVNTLRLLCLPCFWIFKFCWYPWKLLYLISPDSTPTSCIWCGKQTSHLLCFLLMVVWAISIRTPDSWTIPLALSFLGSPGFGEVGRTIGAPCGIFFFLKDALAPSQRCRSIWNTRQASQVPTVLFKEYTFFYSTYILFSTARMEMHAGFLHS